MPADPQVPWTSSVCSVISVVKRGSPGGRPESGVRRDRRRLQAERLEEIVALVVHQDVGREVLHLDEPDGFHAQLREVEALDLADVLLRQDGGGAADAAEVEAAVLA